MVVATVLRWPSYRRRTCFNPWRVFLVVATVISSANAETKAFPFQSLAGFLGRCDPLFIRYSFNASSFQSLAGFLGRCDLNVAEAIQKAQVVSIPGGFSWSLRLLVVVLKKTINNKFQSLAGFLGRCDSSPRLSHKLRSGFQSLAGFLGRCDSSDQIFYNDTKQVSIPGGFSWSLRRQAS